MKNTSRKAKKIKNTTKNFSINTRIVITSILALVIPVILIVSFASVFINTLASTFDFSAVTTSSYSIVNQLQWNQAINNISKVLMLEETDESRYKILTEYIVPIESKGYCFYIERDNKPFYESENSHISFDNIDKSKNLYQFSNGDFTIVNHTESSESSYTIVIHGDNYEVHNISSRTIISDNFESIVTTRSIIIVCVIIGIFALTILIVSLITGKTIISPIKKISTGATEIARGNLDHKIDYSSKNELGELADNFNNMSLQVKAAMNDLHEAEAERKEMIAGIAHDLRTPLTSVKGYVEGLIDGIADTPEKRQQYLKTIYTSTCATEKMLDDLLTVSKLELGDITLNLETVRVSDFVGFASELETELENKNFDFEIKNNTRTDPRFRIDTDGFTRVISNITSNSIKYRRNDVRGKITVVISEYAQTILFEFKDNGIGVDSESLPRIFDTLYRTDKARSNVSEGSGLGLSVCKQIIELHGGMIWAQSRLGNGLSIFISLPIYKENGNE